MFPFLPRSSPVRAFVLSLVCVVCALQPLPDAAAADAGPAPYPARLEDYPGKGWAQNYPWMAQNRAQFWAQRAAKQGAVVFAGDSLTAGWRTLGGDFPGLKLANRGIGGDTSRGLLFRWREDVLDLAPRALVLLIGTNDLSARQAPHDTVANIAQMLDLVRAVRPDMPVVLCTVPPRDSPTSPIDPQQLALLNASLKAMAAQREAVSVLDLHAVLSREGGGPELSYFAPDRLHLGREGYRRWQAALAERFGALGVR